MRMNSQLKYNNSPPHNPTLFNPSSPSSHSSPPQHFQFPPHKQFKNPQNSKPFQRRQAFKHADRKKIMHSEQKSQLQKNPNLKASLIMPQEAFPNKFSIKQERIIRTRNQRTHTQIFSPAECLDSTGVISCEELHCFKNRTSNDQEQMKILKEFNDCLLKQNKILTQKNAILKGLNDQLKKRASSCCEKYQNIHKQLQDQTHHLKRAVENLEEQKLINRCLEDIILQLNARIQALINDSTNVTEDTCDETGQLGELQHQNRVLKEDMVSLTKETSYLQLQIVMLQRERSQAEIQRVEAERLRNHRERLQAQNRVLNRKLQDFLKPSSKMGGKVSKPSDLDYSVSFQLDR